MLCHVTVTSQIIVIFWRHKNFLDSRIKELKKPYIHY